MHALLPAARLHLARGDVELARAAARRGLRLVGDDRLRAVELLTVLVDAELAAGDPDAAAAACAELAERAGDLDLPALQARRAAATARVLAAGGELGPAIALVEAAVDGLDRRPAPVAAGHASPADLARLRERAGDPKRARLDAQAAAGALVRLDVALSAEQIDLLRRLGEPTSATEATAVLRRDGKWWVAEVGGERVRLQDSKGLRYLAELIASLGERHVLDLVDRVEGAPPPGTVDRRALGDAGPLLDGRGPGRLPPTSRGAAGRHRRGPGGGPAGGGGGAPARSWTSSSPSWPGPSASAVGTGGRRRPPSGPA